MTGLKPSKEPIENWETIRDEWLTSVELLVANVELWCRENDWPTRRVVRTVVDTAVGDYRVPSLLLQADLVKLMLDPRVGSASDDGGTADLYVMPEYDDLATLVRGGADWTVYYRYPDRGDKFADGVAFDRNAFVRIVKEMLGHAPA